MTDSIIEIKDTAGVQADLPLPEDRAHLVPSWEELQALYHANFPGMHPTPAMTELAHTLDKAQVAYLEANPSFVKLLAKVYVEWIGLMSVVHRELGIGQEQIDGALIDIWNDKRL